MKRQNVICVFSSAVALLLLAVFFCIWQFCTVGYSEALVMITIIDSFLLGTSGYYWIKALIGKDD